MVETKVRRKHSQPVIPLQVKPHAHQGVPTITGSAISHQAGTVLYGYYSMDYKLPGNDYLRIFANHNKKNIQLFLLTHDPEKLKRLPGARPASLVADAMSNINLYRIRSDHYEKPRSLEQDAKYQLATNCITQLAQLLSQERELASNDWEGQETLRTKVIAIIDKCLGKNLLIAIHPTVSAGYFDTLLYEARKKVQHFQFNRMYPVCRLDQLDFSKQHDAEVFVWDSELHIGQDEEALNHVIRVICQEYGLTPAPSLSNIIANRFERLQWFLRKLWLDGRDWVEHLRNPRNATHISETETRADGLSITKIKPYYLLDGVAQIGYSKPEDIVAAFSRSHTRNHHKAASMEEALHWLGDRPNGSWVELLEKQLVLRLHDEMLIINYFEEQGLFYPLPFGEDLYKLSQLGKHHLYLPERASLQLKAFFSRFPIFFRNLFSNIRQFTTTLYKEFFNYVHANHDDVKLPNQDEKPSKSHRLSYLQEVLYAQGILSNGQTLEEFVQTQLRKNHYVIVREAHPPSPPPYDNPFHRSLEILRHIGGFFVDTSEKNPILGTLAMAAYAYGAGAVIAPEALTSILVKLHLNGLIHGIEPTQALAKWMSHGTTSEAISAAVTYWQAIVVGGDLDQFFIKAVDLLKEKPAEVAIVVALAISLGYGLCKTIPRLGKEMGEFPYINYAALGAKGGAAIYDTVMHPGDDWLLGSIKWFLKGALTLVKLIAGPFVEAYFYGYRSGFISGWKKNSKLLVKTGKQFAAAVADFFLSLATVPLLELSSLLIHVPFRGITKLVSKALVIAGHWQIIGEMLTQFANRPSSWGYLPGFRLSPLYGFSNPFGKYAENKLANVCLNLLGLLVFPPLAVIKNVLLLPVLDLIAFFVRLTFTLLDPISRVVAYILGSTLWTGGMIWDNSLGRVLQFTAYIITLSSNALDNFAGHLKQSALAKIQTHRRSLYHWAFSDDEERAFHKMNTDTDYCQADPMRSERLPHTSTKCLLQNLLSSSSVTFAATEENPKHTSLFHPKKDDPSPTHLQEEVTVGNAL
ncbi:membrane protein [Legionella lansingensis]|uniref:Membrane protein n=1 Tax=Legionella lansingensis TaxID=45067 RepID=A0A0W0VXI4_9GAMM|nr:hypothetical protein [Legionella lansingensis]KTD24812.1 membrane protein [Legionella lansingensis]SNV49050.1 membrane protein [Legionella lansingensis]